MKDDRIFTETATQVKSECIFTKIAEMFWKRVGKLPHGHSISIVPSQEMCTLCFGSHIPLSEETPFFGPASRLRLFCLLTTLRNGHFSVFGEDTVQYLGCNLGRSRRHFYVTSGTKSCNLNRIRRQHVVTPGPPIALILCIPNRSRRQQCVAHNIIGSNATVRSIVHADFVGTRHTVWHNVSHNEHRLLDSLPRGHV